VPTVVVVGDAEQGIAGDIQAALVLSDGVDERIAGKRLACKGMPLEGLQQVQCAVGLLLHKQLCLMDHPPLLPVLLHTCLKREDKQQKQPSPEYASHLTYESFEFCDEIMKKKQ
jgi:hypothetical protein